MCRRSHVAQCPMHTLLGNKALIAAVIIVVGLLMFMAVVICAIALSGLGNSASASVSDNIMLQKQAGGMLMAAPQPVIIHTGGREAPAENSRRVWTLQRGHDYGAHEYM